MKMLVCIFAVSCWIIARITAEVSAKTHYGLKNGLACLQAGNLSQYEDVVWIFKEKRIFSLGKITPIFSGKVHYNPWNFSLCIRNLTDADSGTYQLSAVKTTTYDVFTQLHNLIIQETLPEPVIRTLVLQANQSVGLCNISVNCSVQDELVSAFCNENGCIVSQKPFSKFNTSVNTFNNTIVCTGKNHVSVRSASVGVESTCFSRLKPERTEESSRYPLILILIAVLVITLGFTVFVAKKLKVEIKSNQAQTSNSQLTQSETVVQVPQQLPQVSASPSAVSSREELESEKVDSIYSFLQLPFKTDSQAVEGQKTVPVLSSHSVTVSEAEQPPHVDTHTLYSALKPKKVRPQHHQQAKT